MVVVVVVTVAVVDGAGNSGASSLTGVCVEGSAAGVELIELKSSRPGIFLKMREKKCDRNAVVVGRGGFVQTSRREVIEAVGG